MASSTRGSASVGASMTRSRPPFVTDEQLTYLDDLRQSGVTNMYGAGRYVEVAFPDLTKKQAGEVLGYWMRTFGGPR